MFKHEHAKIIWLLESEVARAHQKKRDTHLAVLSTVTMHYYMSHMLCNT